MLLLLRVFVMGFAGFVQGDEPAVELVDMRGDGQVGLELVLPFEPADAFHVDAGAEFAAHAFVEPCPPHGDDVVLRGFVRIG